MHLIKNNQSVIIAQTHKSKNFRYTIWGVAPAKCGPCDSRVKTEKNEATDDNINEFALALWSACVSSANVEVLETGGVHPSRQP